MKLSNAVLRAGMLAGIAMPAISEAGEIRGRVVSDGDPLARAAVSAMPFESPLEEGLREARRELPPRSQAHVLTGSDGSFVLSLPAPAGTPVRLQVSAPSHVTLQLDRVFDAGEDADAGEVAVPKAEWLAGRVTDPAGAAVVGAAVTLWPEADGGGSSRTATPIAATTDAKGTFTIAGASRAGNRVRIEAPGFGMAELQQVHRGALARPVVLGPERRIEGMVVRGDRRSPAGGALVRFEGKGTTRWVETGPDGRFVLAGVPAGDGRLVAEGGEHGQASLPLGASRPTAPIVLVPGTSLTGRVLDASTRRPVAGVWVRAESGRGAHGALSGREGRYRLSGLPPGPSAVAVNDARFVPWRRTGVHLRLGEATALDVPVTRAATLAGRVVNERGAPVAGALLAILSSEDTGMVAFRRLASAGEASPIRSGGDGTFLASGLAPGKNLRLVARHDEYEVRTVGGLSLEPGQTRTGLVVTLAAGLAVQGVVRGVDGLPVSDAKVTIQRRFSVRARGRGVAVGSDAVPRDPQTTGADGRFAFRGLSPGDWQLTVTRSGFANEVIDPLKVAADMEPLEVVLQPGAAISGFVRDGSGSGLPGIRGLAVESGGGERHRAGMFKEETGPDGSFVIEGLRPGVAYDVRLIQMAPRDTAQAEAVTAPADGLVLTVPGSGRIRGIVEDAGGAPVTDFEVSYELDRGTGGIVLMRVGSRPGAPRAVRAEDGRFVLEDVPAGTWVVEVSSQGYVRGRARGVLVEESGTADVVVRLEKGAVLTGRVVEASSGEPIPDATVEAASGDEPSFRRHMRAMMSARRDTERTDADGAFEIGGLAPGRYTVTARHRDWSEASATVTMADRPATVELRLDQGGAVPGVVLGGGQPVAGAAVDLAPAGGGPRLPFVIGGQTTFSGPDGRFQFERLSRGRYEVTASPRGHTSAPVEAVVTGAAPVAPLTVRLEPGATIRGTITGAPEGAGPLHVSAHGPDGYYASAASPPGGAFELTGVPEGTITVAASVGDFMRGTRSASVDVVIAPGQQEAIVEIAFADGFRLEGRVTRGGEPVADARVHAFSPQASAHDSTSGTGVYALDGLKAGEYTLTVFTAGTSGERRTIDLNADTVLDVDLPAERIAGLVVEAGSGKPLADVQLTAAPRDPGDSAMGRAVTDSSGRFVLEGLAARPYRLSAQRSAYAAEVLEVTPGGGGAEVRIELHRGEGLLVTARDGLYGIPLRALSVRVEDGQERRVFSGEVTLDSDGRGAIPSLASGVYRMVVGASGYAPVLLPSVTVPGPEAQVALTPGGTVQINVGPETLGAKRTARLLDGNGQPHPTSPWSDRPMPLSRTSIRLEHVAPGRYTLSVEDGLTRPVEVREGGETVLALP